MGLDCLVTPGFKRSKRQRYGYVDCETSVQMHPNFVPTPSKADLLNEINHLKRKAMLGKRPVDAIATPNVSDSTQQNNELGLATLSSQGVIGPGLAGNTVTFAAESDQIPPSVSGESQLVSGEGPPEPLLTGSTESRNLDGIHIEGYQIAACFSM